MDDPRASRYQTSFATEEERKFQILLSWRRNNGWKATSQRLALLLELANYTRQEYQAILTSADGDVTAYEKLTKIETSGPRNNSRGPLCRSDVTRSYDNVTYGDRVEARILENEREKRKWRSLQNSLLPPSWDQSVETIHSSERRGGKSQRRHRREPKSRGSVTMPHCNTSQTDDSGVETMPSQAPARNSAEKFENGQSRHATLKNAPKRESNLVELSYGSLPISSKKRRKKPLSQSADNVARNDITLAHEEEVDDVTKRRSVQSAIDRYETLSKLNAGKKRESMAESIARYNINRGVTSSSVTSLGLGRADWSSDVKRHSRCRLAARSHHFTVGGKGISPSRFKGLISGMALLSDGSIVASDGENRRIQIFDNGGKFVTSFDTNTELKPKGVCVTMEGKIAVCCGDSVRLFDEEGNMRLTFGRGVFRNNAYAVCCDRDNNYYVTDIVTHSISIHDARGNIRKRFGFEGSSMIHFNQPVSLAINSDNKLFVSDSQNHCVKVYKLSGRPLFRIGAQGSADGLFWNPLGICVDSEDNLCVADCGNNRISQFNSEGQFLRHLLTEEDGLLMPSLIQVNDRGQLVVCEWEKQLVKVFTIETAI